MHLTRTAECDGEVMGSTLAFERSSFARVSARGASTVSNGQRRSNERFAFFVALIARKKFSPSVSASLRLPLKLVAQLQRLPNLFSGSRGPSLRPLRGLFARV